MPERESTAGDELNRALLLAQVEADAWADAASSALGVNRTDFACLRALYLEGSCTAGRLAEMTGLTTGAVTGVLDRLAKANFVRRAADPDDRRKVIVQVSGERAGVLDAMLSGMAADAVSNGVAEFLEAHAATLRRETERLRAAHAAAPLAANPEGTLSIPLRPMRAALFEVVGGAMDLTVEAADLPDELVHAELTGPALRITEKAGHVRIAHRALAIFRERPSGVVRLNRDVAWALRISGGANHLTFAFADGTVASVEVEGGSGELLFQFGEPPELVPLKVNGGASRIAVERPAATPLEVAVRGRASNFSADGHDFGAVTHHKWSSHPESDPLIRVVVRGGMNRISVSERK